MSRKVVKMVEKLSGNYLNQNKLELVKVDFTKEGPHRYLRVFIDSDNGVNLKDCEKFSRFLNKELDENLIKEKYFLEVSSPGVERELYNERDYKKFTGNKVDLKLYQAIEGRKKVTGVLKDFNDSVFKVEADDKLIEIPRNKVAKINLHHDFK